jgi:MFS family permease
MTEKLAARPSYKWLLVGMLWFVCFFNYADRQAIFSLFPLLHRELHLSSIQLGIVGSSFMWTYALVGPGAGWLCDRLPRKTLVLGGLIFWSIVTAATALAHTYTQLVLCRALGGLGEAFYFPAAMSLIGDYHGPSTRSRAMAFHQSSVYAGSIAGGALSGIIGQTYGWRVTFVWFGALGILLGAVLWVFVHEPARGQAQTGAVLESAEDPVVISLAAPTSFFSGLRDVLSRPLVLVLITVFMGANFVAVVFLTWMPTFLFEKFHMSLAMAGLNGTAFLQIASVVGVLGGGILADRIVRRGGTWIRGGRMLTQSLGLLCGVPFLFLAGWTTAVPALLTALVGFGLFKGLYDANLWAALYDVVPVHRRGSAVGFMNSLGWLGGGAAPVLIALAARRYGMSAAISATAAIYFCIGSVLLVAALLTLRGLRIRRPPTISGN